MLHRRFNLLQRIVVLPAIPARCCYLSLLFGSAMIVTTFLLIVVLLVALHHIHLFRLLRVVSRWELNWGNVGRFRDVHGLETLCVFIILHNIVRFYHLHWLIFVLQQLFSFNRTEFISFFLLILNLRTIAIHNFFLHFNLIFFLVVVFNHGNTIELD